jgi:predicted XRE-type DNA-binding protein
MIEEWKTIKEFPDYRISNLGKVKSFKKYHYTNERILKSSRDRNGDGYLFVNLYINGKSKICCVHRLVLCNFKPIDNHLDFEVNHMDGNKLNNYINNLEWCTKSENEFHAYKLGLKVSLKGEDHGRSKLKEDDIKEIRTLLKKGEYSQRRIAEIFNVSQSQISRIKLGQRWDY